MVLTKAMDVPTMKTMRLPYMSANELHINGPIVRPRAGIATVQFTSAYEISSSS